MKVLNTAIFLIFIFGCKKPDCEYCFSYTSPLRFSILDNNNTNLLDPSLGNKLEINSIRTNNSTNINFELKSTIGGFETGFWFIESIDRPKRAGCDDMLDCALCVNEECELYVSYLNSNEIDTLNVLYERNSIEDEDGCICTGYPLKYFKYNGIEIHDGNEKTGAAILRK